MPTSTPVRFETGRAMLLAGLRRAHPYSVTTRELSAQWEEFHKLGRLPGQIGTTAYGVMCGSTSTGFEYLCAYEVQSFEGLGADIGRVRVQPQQYAVFLHEGPIATIRSTWEGIYSWLPRSGYVSAHRPDLEVYDERFDAASSNGVVEIRLAVVPAAEASPTAERETVTSRFIAAPRERVFAAFRDPARLARWWGPTGFSSSFDEFEPRSGGHWRFTMHGPDGTDYPNQSVFVDVTAPERFHLMHLPPHVFELFVTLESQDGGTLVRWRQVFPSAEDFKRVAKIVIPANEQNLDRWTAEVLGSQ